MHTMFNYSCPTSFGGDPSLTVYHYIITDSSDNEWIDLVHSDDESKADEHVSVMENEEDYDLNEEENNGMLYPLICMEWCIQLKYYFMVTAMTTLSL